MATTQLTKIRKALRVAGNLTVLGNSVLTGSVTLGSGGSAVKGIVAGTLSCIIGSAGGTATTEINTAVANMGLSDIVVPQLPTTLDDDLIFTGLRVPAAGTVQARFYNAGPTVAGGTVSIPYLWVKLT